ncbi:spermidine hydroxycinnamoyl transferase-like [Quercus lobata]|uniref:Spermidine hydroxycinnamoyl transferase n=1 Tax=Quercus lobata TaxID=97700 RepID=A0A7N2LSM1_QUELO|nr:spermidine hydroxycinnamoyl transferase-like [Quercus lobata]
MTSIRSISVVVPSEPTPSGLLRLPETDQVAHWTHTPLIYIYRAKSNNTTIPFSFEAMKNSLSRALIHFYPLAGRLHWIEGGRLELDCNAMGVQLLEACSEAELDELGDFAPTDAVRDLVPKVDYTTPIEEWPLFLVQVTRFGCGGLCVGVAISHTMVDGRSATHFINSWAKLSRGYDLEDVDMPFLDRTVLRSSEPVRIPRFDHIEYTTKPPVLIGRTDANEERKKETSATLLKLTREQVEVLKKRANQDVIGVTIRPYSRYEAIAGHMWRCACKVRAVDSHNSQSTRARLTVDIRNRLKPSLPERYFGNAISATVTPICLYEDLLSRPLSYSAGKLREAIERMDDEYIRSALDFISSQKDVSGLRSNFHIQGYGPFLGNPNIFLGSWIGLPIYDADFGWGKPIYVGPGLLNMDGKSFIMTSPTADGSLIIALSLQRQYMDSFKKIFYEDISVSLAKL